MSGSKMAAQQAPRRAWYMWTDSWFDAAARQNPLRWSKSMSAAALVRELSELSAQCQSRPLRIFLDLADGVVERDFSSVALGLRWLRGKFNCDARPTPSDQRWSLSACMKCSHPEEHEELVHRSDSSRRRSELLSSSVPMSSPGASSDNSRGSDRGTLPTACEASEHAATISADGQGDTAHLEDEQASCAKLQYMWADAGLFPHLAQANPVRWSSFMSAQAVTKELVASRSRARPVTLRTDAPGHHEIKTFENADSVLRWIRSVFKIEQLDHKCVVCLEAEVTTMLMPCRHAVLCDDCAATILAGRAACPVCREGIRNHARGHFAEDYVELMQAMQTRMESSHAAACEGMYNSIRPLMVTGALLGTGAATCFVLAPTVAPVLGAAALAVGYLPWFATTVEHFEKADVIGDGGGRLAFFSAEDWSRPVTLVAKALVMAVVAPAAAVVFFIPYGFYAGAVRPATKHLAYGLVRLCAFAHVYAMRPTAQGLHVLCRSILHLLTNIGYFTLDAVVSLGSLIASGSVRGAKILRSIANCLYEHVLVPVGDGLRHGAEFTYENIVSPIGHACRRGASNARNGVVRATEATYDHLIVPGGHAVCKALACLGDACVTVGMHVYSYVLLPSGRGIVCVLRKSGDLLADGAGAVYAYILVPIAEHTVTGAAFAYSEALVPLEQFTLRALSMLVRGVPMSAELLWSNIIVPSGQALLYPLKALAYLTWMGLKASGEGLASAAALGYAYVLLPCAGGLALVARGVGHGLHATASAVARMAGATYERIFIPLAQAIEAGASTVYVYVLQPSGRVIYGAGAAVLETAQVALITLAQQVATCAQVVYVYVLQPTGEVVLVAAAASRDAMRTCAGETTQAAAAIASTLSEAGRHTIDAFASYY